MNITIFYPVSGHALEVVGDYKGFVTIDPEKRTSSPIIEVSEPAVLPGGQAVGSGEVMVIDPRCVIITSDSQTVLYNPREHLHLISKDFRLWLHANKDWPGRLGIPNLS